MENEKKFQCQRREAWMRRRDGPDAEKGKRRCICLGAGFERV